MKKIINTTLFAAVFAAASVTAFAQAAGTTGAQTTPPTNTQQKGKGQKADPMMLLKRDQEVLSKLNLTSDQETSIKKLKSETESKLKELMKGKAKKDERAGMREKVKEAFEGYKKGLQEILTPVQFTDYAKEMKKLMKKAKDKKDGGN